MAVPILKFLGALTLLLAAASPVRAITIHIDNNLDVALQNGTVSNKQDVELDSAPPATIAAGESSSFKISFDTYDVKNRHLHIEFEIEGSTDKLGVIYRQSTGASHCPKDHPDWVKETVTHCGGNNGDWTYTFTRQ